MTQTDVQHIARRVARCLSFTDTVKVDAHLADVGSMDVYPRRRDRGCAFGSSSVIPAQMLGGGTWFGGTVLNAAGPTTTRRAVARTPPARCSTQTRSAPRILKSVRLAIPRPWSSSR